jgi:hypothetical protein
MAILRLSIHPREPYIFRPTIYPFLILIEDYVKIDDTFEFFDSLSKISGIELGLGPFQIKNFFKLYFITF